MLRCRGIAVGIGIGVLVVAGRPSAEEAPSTRACLECHAVDGNRPAGTAPDGVSLYMGD